MCYSHILTSVNGSRRVCFRPQSFAARDGRSSHPCRAAAYRHAIRASPRASRAVSAAWMARPVHAEEQIRSASDVDELIAQGRVVRTPLETAAGGAWDEYFNHALRLDTLTHYLERVCLPAVRRSAYADLHFYFYVRNAVQSSRFTPHGWLGFGANWCHFYDKPMDNSEASTVLSLSSGITLAKDTDFAMARELSLALCNAVSSGTGDVHELRAVLPPGDPPQPMVMLAAQHRSMAEMYCAHFAGSPEYPSYETFVALGMASAFQQLINLKWSEHVLNAAWTTLQYSLVRTAKAWGLSFVVLS